MLETVVARGLISALSPSGTAIRSKVGSFANAMEIGHPNCSAKAQESRLVRSSLVSATMASDSEMPASVRSSMLNASPLRTMV